MNREVVEPGSEREAEVAKSILFGLLGQLCQIGKVEFQRALNYKGVTIERASPARSGVIFTGLVIHMRSGDYRVTIEREKTT